MTKLISIDCNPVPADAEVETFTTSDGAEIRIAHFPAENGQATVIVAPGWSEFIEKYFEVAEDLRARNYNVTVIDWRGQGLSSDPSNWRGYFDRLAEDLRELNDGPVAARFPGRRLLLTHSMGGAPALILLAGGYEGFARAILTAPMTRLFPAITNAVLGAAASALANLGASNIPAARGDDDSELFDGNMFTHDRARHERFRLLKQAEPAAARQSPTYGWVNEAIRTGNKLHTSGFFDDLKTPVRIISAGDERRIDGADHAAIASRHELIDHVTVPGALHEIMMETDDLRAAFWKEADAFFSAAAPSTAAA